MLQYESYIVLQYEAPVKCRFSFLLFWLFDFNKNKNIRRENKWNIKTLGIYSWYNLFNTAIV